MALKDSDIKDIEQLISDCSQEETTVGLLDKGSHEANAQWIKGCLEFEPSTECWLMMEKTDNRDGGKIFAVTGNGPKGKANAVLFMHARNIIRELLQEREELRTQLARFVGASPKGLN